MLVLIKRWMVCSGNPTPGKDVEKLDKTVFRGFQWVFKLTRVFLFNSQSTLGKYLSWKCNQRYLPGIYKPKTKNFGERERLLRNYFHWYMVHKFQDRGKCVRTFCLLRAAPSHWPLGVKVLLSALQYFLSLRRTAEWKKIGQKKKTGWESCNVVNTSVDPKSPYFLSGCNKSSSKFSIEDHKINKNAYRRRSRRFLYCPESWHEEEIVKRGENGWKVGNPKNLDDVKGWARNATRPFQFESHAPWKALATCVYWHSWESVRMMQPPLY